jgi:hypothetical protein
MKGIIVGVVGCGCGEARGKSGQTCKLWRGQPKVAGAGWEGTSDFAG